MTEFRVRHDAESDAQNFKVGRTARLCVRTLVLETPIWRTGRKESFRWVTGYWSSIGPWLVMFRNVCCLGFCQNWARCSDRVADNSHALCVLQVQCTSHFAMEACQCRGVCVETCGCSKRNRFVVSKLFCWNPLHYLEGIRADACWSKTSHMPVLYII